MKRIVLVEDEELLADLIEKKLLRLGYEVKVAEDGEEGIFLIKQEKPDLVLLDILLPKRTGMEVMEAMREDKDTKDLPVIIISNSGQEVEVERAKELGAKDWLVKTNFDPEEVIEKVKAHIGT